MLGIDQIGVIGMKLLLTYLKTFQKEYFNLRLYLAIAGFLAICISLNFYFDFENAYLDQLRGYWIHWPVMSGMLMLPFLVICFLIYWLGNDKAWLSSREFWIKVVIGFAIIGFERSFFLYDYVADLMSAVDRRFFMRSMSWGRSYFTTFSSLMLFYWLYEKHRDAQKNWFGLRVSDTNFRSYLSMVAIIVIGIAIASFAEELHTYYPRYPRSGGDRFAEAHGFGEWFSILIYEFVYGSYFLNVELFFRGFLVIGFSRILGGNAVLAMLGSYVALHFGKPVAECVSSAFGGYIVGVLAFYSDRIWGGVFLHVALAWSMELFAWLQNTFNP